ncbi:MAG: permease [Candidatus Alcyoniella australis]|nr:permease [Candidatus Alcyoniella australis]
MKKGKGLPSMLIPTILLGVIALALLYLGYSRGDGVHLTGLKSGMTMLLQITPLLIFALIIAGMVPLLIPQETVAKWIGVKSGFRGIVIGSLAGGLAPGGPYVSLPLAVSLLRSGAGVGTMVAFLTGWSLYAVSRLPLEVGILGWKLTVIRLVSTLIFPPLAGLLAQFMFSWVKDLN